MDDDSLIESIRQGQHKALAEVYYEYKYAFIRYCLKNHAFKDEQDIKNIYHKTIMSFQKSCLKGRVVSLKSARLFTYLIEIAKNHIRNHFNESRRNSETQTLGEVIDRVRLPEEKELSERAFLIKKIFKTDLLGETCKELLFLHYYKSYPVEVIKERMELPTPNAVTKQKIRCEEKLKHLIQKIENKSKRSI